MLPMSILRTTVILLALTFANALRADSLEMPAVIADHMVFQQGEPIHVWGTADAGSIVRVHFAGQDVDTTTNQHGKWMVTLDALSANSVGQSLTVRSGSEMREINDVVVGEVWLCSGQSNMVMRVRSSARAAEFSTAANESRIRMFIMPQTAMATPQDNVKGTWHVNSPETVGAFSAVAYHFGLNIIEQLDVPIGLVNASWGGSTVEAWVSRPTLDPLPDAKPYLDVYDKLLAAASVDINTFTAPDDHDAVDLSTWKSMALPMMIEAAGYNFDGMMWFRRTIDIPEAWAGRSLTLSLGPIDDNDVTYFNGKRIGATNNHLTPRVYNVPAELVKSGKTTIAVRVEDTGYGGGFAGTPNQLTLHPVDDANDLQLLAGNWRFFIVSESRTLPAQHRPANLYNGMIHPLQHVSFRGAIWYQGESNAYADRGQEYFTIFPAMIHNWRTLFDAPELPFYFVQLPNFSHDEPNTPWRYPLLRQAQLESLSNVPHTGMAVTLELGEANDIHPRNKHDVGERLARWALVDTYGVNGLIKSGPIVQQAEFGDDNEVRMTFDVFGSSFATRPANTTLTGFELAGDDGVFHPAAARVEGDQSIVVSAKGVNNPHTVRYGWRNNATEANLVNAVGLPASPFRLTRQQPTVVKR